MEEYQFGIGQSRCAVHIGFASEQTWRLMLSEAESSLLCMNIIAIEELLTQILLSLWRQALPRKALAERSIYKLISLALVTI